MLIGDKVVGNQGNGFAYFNQTANAGPDEYGRQAEEILNALSHEFSGISKTSDEKGKAEKLIKFVEKMDEVSQEIFEIGTANSFSSRDEKLSQISKFVFFGSMVSSLATSVFMMNRPVLAFIAAVAVLVGGVATAGGIERKMMDNPYIPSGYGSLKPGQAFKDDRSLFGQAQILKSRALSAMRDVNLGTLVEVFQDVVNEEQKLDNNVKHSIEPSRENVWRRSVQAPYNYYRNMEEVVRGPNALLV